MPIHTDTKVETDPMATPAQRSVSCKQEQQRSGSNASTRTLPHSTQLGKAKID